MILVFGGTTEGRKAVKELEEAGNVFYYSTKGSGQDVSLHHGVRLEGAMLQPDMEEFCRTHDIRLIVDAAHPFAANLHQSVAQTAQNLNVPVIRFDRIYPQHDYKDGIVWCKGYEDAVRKIRESGADTLIATTGVQSICHLKELEAPTDEYKPVRCFFRILDRDDSRRIAHEQGIADDRLLYYSTSDHLQNSSQDAPESDFDMFCHSQNTAILMKESGMSGGYVEKLSAAKNRGMKIFVLSRPAIPDIFHVVDGEHGLRLMIERLLPEFFPLHSGITTGTCATAAAVAAQLYRGYNGTHIVPVVLPNGETIRVEAEVHDGYASVIKHSGDDPDVTDGTEIRAQVRYLDECGYIGCTPDGNGYTDSHLDLESQESDIIIKGGEGVGTITVLGFDYPPGEAAINKMPRQMIRDNLRRITPRRLEVVISVPNGERLAARTFNPRLGIVGGISIVGVSGIIKPFSEESFLSSIHKCIGVAKATGRDIVVINSGAKSERYVRQRFPDLPQQSFVEYGNYIGDTIRMASEADISNVVLGVMLGKAVKLAAGNLDTHSRRTIMDKDFIASMVAEAISEDERSQIIEQVGKITLARELWNIIPQQHLARFADVVIRHCHEVCAPLLPNGNLTVLLIDDDGNIYTKLDAN